jgi:hypothetical protein
LGLNVTFFIKESISGKTGVSRTKSVSLKEKSSADFVSGFAIFVALGHFIEVNFK